MLGLRVEIRQTWGRGRNIKPPLNARQEELPKVRFPMSQTSHKYEERLGSAGETL